MIIRWLIGFFKALIGIWTKYEWQYYASEGLDPRMAAFHRYEVDTVISNRAPETEAERIMPQKNRSVVLKDKYHQSPDEVLFFDTNEDKTVTLVEEYERKMRTMSAGDFYYKMVRQRNLDFIHNIKFEEDRLPEASTEDLAEQEREKFLR